jgi:UPF0755 protein
VSRKRKSRFGWIFVLSALLLGAAAYWTFDRYAGFADTPVASAKPDASIVVARGDSFAVVLGKLHAAGVSPARDLEWRLLARQLGTAGHLQVGEYAFAPGTTPRDLLLRMRDGKVIGHRFTLVEGWNIRQLRAALAKAMPLEQETAALDDAALMARLGFAGQHPEGRFLPETYLYTRGDSDLDILARAHRAMQQALDDGWKTRAPDLPLKSKDEALILASIVEKETGVAEDRARIAGVFVRRIGKGMRLETDPTVVYGLGARYDGNIRKQDLQADNPYNTYRIAGLPPTPISMPGKAALQAVLHPAPGDAVYFVSSGDGSGRSLFAATYAEHQANVRAYLARYRAGLAKGPMTGTATSTDDAPAPASVAPPASIAAPAKTP